MNEDMRTIFEKLKSEVHYFNREAGYEHTTEPDGSGGAALITALKK